MYEKVNPSHPDKVADRIAGAIVDLCYEKQNLPKVAVEVLLGHGYCYVIVESSVELKHADVEPIVQRITGAQMTTRLLSVPQDQHLAHNQADGLRCGDNGIFKGTTVTEEQQLLTDFAGFIYQAVPHDGKYVISEQTMTVCQSNLKRTEEAFILQPLVRDFGFHGVVTVNPLGEWTGGTDVDCGATNRKLGSDMGDGVTGGGLHGKDLSKADVSVIIVCHLLAQKTGKTVTAICSIGDENVTFQIGDKEETFSFDSIVTMASVYIKRCGGFEKFAEWGLIRPTVK